MEIKEYQKSSIRTLSQIKAVNNEDTLNLLHMVIGMSSELNELFEAIEKNDRVNIHEEIADIFWYLSNYANIINLDLDKVFKIEEVNYYYINSDDDYTKPIVSAISKLNNLEKRIFVYKKDIPREEIVQAVLEVAMRISDFCVYNGLNLKAALNANINKLKVRFPEKFTEENANNRNLDLEYSKLSEVEKN